MRAEEAKNVQEKAAKIKEWVTLKLAEVSPILLSGGEHGMGGPGCGVAPPLAFLCLLHLEGP